MTEANTSVAGVFSKSVHSGKWLFLSIAIQRLLSIGTFFVLARILAPKDYGAMEVIFIVTGLIGRFTAHSLEAALIQKKGEIEFYLNEVWTISLIRSTAVFFIIYFFAPKIADFFHIQDSVFLLSVSGLFLLIPSVAPTQELYFFKNLDFRKIFLRDLSGNLAYGAVAISWAIFKEASLSALFLGHIARLFATVVLGYVLVYPRYSKPSLNFRKLRALMGYSKWVFGKSVIDYFLGVLDSSFVGRILNPASLGFYSKASNLATVVTSPVVHIFTKVGFPAYSKLQDDLTKIQEGFAKTFDLLMIVAIPFSLLLLMEGGAIIEFLLGQKWLSIVLPLKILSVAEIIFALCRTLVPIFDSLARPDINFKANLLQLSLASFFIYFGVARYGLAGAAWAMLSVSAGVLLFTAIKGKKLLKIRKDRFMPSIISVTLSASAVIFLEMLFRIFFRHKLGVFPIVVWTGFLGMAYLAALWFISGKFKSGPRDTAIAVINELKSGFKT